MKRVVSVFCLATILLGCGKNEMKCYHCAVCGEDLCETMNIINDFNQEQQRLGEELLERGRSHSRELDEAIKSWWAKNKDKYSVPKRKYDLYDFQRFDFPEEFPNIYWNDGKAYMSCGKHSQDTYKQWRKDAATETNELKCQVCGKAISIDIRNDKHASLELVPGHWYPCCSGCYSRLHKGD